MPKSTPNQPKTQKPSSPLRLPQRSEEISGNEQNKGIAATPIAAEQAKAGKQKKSP